MTSKEGLVKRVWESLERKNICNSYKLDVRASRGLGLCKVSDHSLYLFLTVFNGADFLKKFSRALQIHFFMSLIKCKLDFILNIYQIIPPISH